MNRRGFLGLIAGSLAGLAVRRKKDRSLYVDAYVDEY